MIVGIIISIIISIPWGIFITRKQVGTAGFQKLLTEGVKEEVHQIITELSKFTLIFS